MSEIMMGNVNKPRALALNLCAREGNKKQINVAQMSEIVGDLSDIAYECSAEELMTLMWMLWKNGLKRAQKRA